MRDSSLIILIHFSRQLLETRFLKTKFESKILGLTFGNPSQSGMENVNSLQIAA